MIHFIIPTFERYNEIRNCINAIRTNTSRRLLGQIVVVDSNTLQTKYLNDVTVLYLEKTYPGIARNIGANFLKFVDNDDYFIFLDDDIQLLGNFRMRIHKIIRCYEKYNVGCLQLGIKKGKPWVKVKLGFTGGGILIKKGKPWVKVKLGFTGG